MINEHSSICIEEMTRKVKGQLVYSTHWENEVLSTSQLKAGTIPDDYIIRMFGLTQSDETVCVRIEGFTPYVYIGFPDVDVDGRKITWQQHNIAEVRSLIVERLCPYNKNHEKANYNMQVTEAVVVYKKTMKTYSTEKKPYLRVAFANYEQTRQVKYRLVNRSRENKHYIPTLNATVEFSYYEDWIDPLIKFMSYAGNLSPVGWKEITLGSLIQEDFKVTTCKYEIMCNWKDIKAAQCDLIVHPMILCLDIETYSSRWNLRGSSSTSAPDESLEGDEVYMISCIFHRFLSDRYEKYLICDRPCDHVDDDVTLIQCKNEGELLLAFRDLVTRIDPDILLGHNILNYDLKYLAYRSGCPQDKNGRIPDWQRKKNYWPDFSVLGRVKDKKCAMITSNWASAAYKGMNFNYINMDGRLLVDTCPYMRRTYPSLENVKLDFISEKFLGEGKHDVDYKEQFRIYDTKDPTLMAKVARYCVQDTVLPLKLLYKLNIWVDLNEISSIVGIPIFQLYTRGQSVRGISQVYREIYNEYVLDLDAPKETVEGEDDEKYQGAFIVKPTPGLYENVICTDFASLYPSMIRAFNLDYTTYVPDDMNVPDDMCNIVEWDEDGKKGEDPKHYRFRFIKSEHHKGILPTILDKFTAARGIAKKEMEKYTKPDSDGCPLPGFEIQFASANSKQKELKVSSNSVYGLMGFRKGRMGLLPGAMSTTALGRISINKVIEYVLKKYKDAGAKLVYGDTDSAMFTFTTWDYKTSYQNGRKIASEVTTLFPPPMKLEFEKIFKVFFILTKKRYAGYICNADGEIIQFMKKGMMLARRNYCRYAKNIYEPLLELFLKTAHEGTFNDPLTQRILFRKVSVMIMNHFSKLMSHSIPLEHLMIRNTWDPKTLKTIQTDEGEKEIYTYKNTQAHDVLVQRLMASGVDIQAGDVVYYVFVEQEGKTRQAELVEDPTVHQKTPGSKINNIYYLIHQVQKNLSEMVETAFKTATVDGINRQAEKLVAKLIQVHWNYSICVSQLKGHFTNYK